MTINKYLGNNERMNFAIQELEKKTGEVILKSEKINPRKTHSFSKEEKKISETSHHFEKKNILQVFPIEGVRNRDGDWREGK